MAEILEVPPNYLKSGFDYHTPYRGQTFMLSENIQADRITVYVSPNIYQSFTFTLLLTEVDTADGIHPANVLFESQPFTIEISGQTEFTPYTADLGGISLTEGQTYAFILDIFGALNQVDPYILWQYGTLTGMNDENIYAEGDAISFTPDCTESDSGLPCGSRDDHFAGTWTVNTAEDMGFILDYTPVPTLPAPVVISPILELLLLNNR
jgi:hypothetical protein